MDGTASLHPLKSHRMMGGGRDAIKSFHQSVISSWQISTIAALTLSLFQFLISELHFVLTASVCQFPKSGHVIFIVSGIHNICKDQYVCMFMRQTFFFWCRKILNPEEFFEILSSNIPNISLQQTINGRRCKWFFDDLLQFNTILLSRWYYTAAAEIQQSFSGELLMVCAAFYASSTRTG